MEKKAKNFEDRISEYCDISSDVYGKPHGYLSLKFKKRDGSVIAHDFGANSAIDTRKRQAALAEVYRGLNLAVHNFLSYLGIDESMIIWPAKK